MNYKHNSKLTSLAKTLRKNMTKEEKHLWYDFLSQYPIRFLRQKVIDDYIVDFYCSSVGLIVELDGAQHYSETGELKDRIRTEQLERHALTVMRIPNKLIHTQFAAVCAYIDDWVQNALREKAKHK